MHLINNNYDAIIIDLETNGLNPKNSILQFTAFLLKEGLVKKIINRYYYPKDNEPLIHSAVLTHKLDNFKISELRKEQKATYPRFFDEDTEILNLLKSLSSKISLIAYNTDFETSFLSQRGIYFRKTIDIMKLYTPILKIPHYYYGYKYPKLIEALSILEQRYSVIAHDKLHNALIDTYYTYRLFHCYPNLVNFDFQDFYSRNTYNFWKYFLLSGMFKHYPRFWFWKSVKQKLQKLLKK